MRAKLVLAVAVLMAGSVGLAGPSGAAPPSPTPAVQLVCGATITTSVRLANDLIDCPGNGLIIGADGITLDLGGHTVDGDGTVRPGCPPDEACNVGIVNSTGADGRPGSGPGHRGVTITNGTITGFGEYGIYGESVVDNRVRDLRVSDNPLGGVGWCGAATSVIERVRASSNGVGLSVFCPDRDSHDVRIQDNVVKSSSDIQIFVFHGSRIRIERNTVSGGSAFAGIFLFDGPQHVQVTSNRVTGAAVGILIDHANDNEVSANDVSGNSDDIAVFGDRNTILANRVSDAVGCADDPNCGAGISIDGGRGNVVARNLVRRTAGDGIRVAAFDPDTPNVASVVAWNNVADATGDGYSVGTVGDGSLGSTRLDHNIATRSGDDGFDTESPLTVMTSNLATRNRDLGIEAVPGVIDGGGNRARANGNPAQCTNVSCA